VPIPAKELSDDLSAHATGIEGVSGEAAARSRVWAKRLNDVSEELPQDNQSLYEPLSNSDSKPQSNIFPTCWMLILVVLTLAFGSAAIGIYYSTKHQMGDGFTTASWVVAVGALLLAGPIAYHYQYCGCWKPRDSNSIRSCWILIFCGSGFFLTSGAIGITFSVSENRMGDGFSAAGWVPLAIIIHIVGAGRREKGIVLKHLKEYAPWISCAVQIKNKVQSPAGRHIPIIDKKYISQDSSIILRSMFRCSTIHHHISNTHTPKKGWNTTIHTCIE